MKINPELTNVINYNGRIIKLFPSTQCGNTVSAKIMEGDGKGKMITVCLPKGFEFEKLD